MTDKLGCGNRIYLNSRMIATGTSKVFSTTQYEVFNLTNFPTLTFTYNPCPCMSFSNTTGEFIFDIPGLLVMLAAVNVDALQSFSEIIMIPQFDFGSGWVQGVPRKETFVAIHSRQLSWSGEVEVMRGTKLRFCFKGENGNIRLITETLDPGGSLETQLPSAVLYLKMVTKIFKKCL